MPVTINYDPVVCTLKLEDPRQWVELCAMLQVENPNYDSERPDQPPVVEFFERDRKGVLTGHLPIVEKWAKDSGVQLARRGFPTFPKVEARADIVPGVELRDYQVEALQKLLDGVRGVAECATGAGKTEIAIAAILTLGKPRTLYMVPDTLALDEMYGRFVSRGLTEDEVGRLGGGHDEAGKRVVIAVVNSLFSGIKRSYPATMDLLQNCELFVADEVHHQATAFSWQAVAANCKAHRRLGLSGTPYKDSRSRFNPYYLHPFDSWLTGYLGPTLVYVSPKQLQEKGQLTSCRVFSFVSGGPWIHNSRWQVVYHKGVVCNVQRNYRVCTIAANLVDMGYYPLISVEQLEHGRLLQRILKSYYNVNSVCSYGSGVVIVPKDFANPFSENFEVTPVEMTRDDEGKKLKKPRVDPDFVHLPADFPFRRYFEAGEIGVLIGSRIYDECISIDFLTDLINAAGMKSIQRVRQKIGRILRLSEGKTLSRVWDVWDDTHYFLLAHSKQRLQIAREEGYEISSAPYGMTEVRYTDYKFPIRKWMKKISV
jgi:hypothetical protein